MLRKREAARQRRDETRREREREKDEGREEREERRRSLSPERRKASSSISKRVERRAQMLAHKQSARDIIASFNAAPAGAHGREVTPGEMKALNSMGTEARAAGEEEGGVSSASGGRGGGGGGGVRGLYVDPIAVADAVALAAGVSGESRKGKERKGKEGRKLAFSS